MTANKIAVITLLALALSGCVIPIVLPLPDGEPNKSSCGGRSNGAGC